MEVQAKLNYLRVTPRKARMVCDLIRGQAVQRALDTLRFVRRGCAKDILKLVESAVANAQEKGKMDVDNLYVHRITVDAGPTLKRSLPRARGMATPILKRTSRIKVILSER